jgi:hypothetical protein
MILSCGQYTPQSSSCISELHWQQANDCHSEPRSQFEWGEKPAFLLRVGQKQISQPQKARLRDDKFQELMWIVQA